MSTKGENEDENRSDDEGEHVEIYDATEKASQNRPEKEDDGGWDETETLADRIRKMSEEKRVQNSESPRQATPALSVVSKGENGDGDDGHANQDANQEIPGERQSGRPSIWKELEKMQGRARGGGGGGGGMHRSRGPIAPRFSKPPDQFFGNRRGDFGGPSGPRFSGPRDRNYARNRDGNFQESTPIAKGFGGGGDDRAANRQGSAKETPAHRTFYARGGRASHPGQFRGGGGGGRGGGASSRKPFLDREYDDEDEDEEERPRVDHRYSKARQSRSREDYSDDEAPAAGGDKNQYWLVDADDSEIVPGYNRSQMHRGSRESPPLEPIRRALDNFDQSIRATKHLVGLLLKVADDYCVDDSDRWLKLIDQYLMAYAVDQGGTYVEVACTFFGRCIDRASFQKAAYTSLVRHVSNLMAPHEWTEKDHRHAQNLCDMFGRLLIFVWPSGWDSCAKECNMISYAIMNAVQTWLRALDKASTRDTPIREDIAEVSAICLWHVATSTGRKLWLKWPDLIDQMYSTIRLVIVSRSCPLNEETKSKLLDLYVKLNEWPKPTSQSAPRHTPKRDAIAQTEPISEGYPPTTHHPWAPQDSAFEVVAPSSYEYVGRQAQGQVAHPTRFSVPPPPIPYTAAIPHGTAAMLHTQQQQQQQKLASFHGAIQPTANIRSFIGPMKRQ